MCMLGQGPFAEQTARPRIRPRCIPGGLWERGAEPVDSLYSIEITETIAARCIANNGALEVSQYSSYQVRTLESLPYR